jgi:hypothetical protein
MIRRRSRPADRPLTVRPGIAATLDAIRMLVESEL